MPEPNHHAVLSGNVPEKPIPGAVLHIPHASTFIPDSVRATMLLSDEELNKELIRMTDRFSQSMRYLQQTLAILAWPIGFAVVDLVGYALLTSVTSAVSAGAIAVGVATKFTPATLVIGGIVAVWLILGSLVTPIVMQMLFCSGTPMSSAVGHAIQMGLGFAGVSRFLQTGGGEGSGATAPSNPPDAPTASAPPNPPPTPPPTPALPYSPLGPLAPSSGSVAPIPPLPSGSSGLLQTPRGSLAVGKVADSISPAQAQNLADQSGTPFTQAFSNGSVVTHQPAVSRMPAPSTFIAPLTPNPLSV
jgi:hypothetical protein